VLEAGFFIDGRRGGRCAAAAGIGRERGRHRGHGHDHRRVGAALEDDAAVAVAHIDGVEIIGGHQLDDLLKQVHIHWAALRCAAGAAAVAIFFDWFLFKQFHGPPKPFHPWYDNRLRRLKPPLLDVTSFK
jgi:hypothetical protein